MNHHKLLLVCGLMTLWTVSFAAVEVSDQQDLYTGGKIPRPETIWVYDLAATPGDVPPQSDLSSIAAAQDSSQTDEQIATGRQIGTAIAADLIDEFNAMGMKAVHGDATTKPQVNDLVFYGYLLSVEIGDKKKRVTVGLGKGDAELKVAVEGFLMTDNGLQKMGSGDTDAKGSKSPGAAVGAVGFVALHNPLGLIVSTGKKEYDEKEGKAGVGGREKDTAAKIAGELKKHFQEQGWVSDK